MGASSSHQSGNLVRTEGMSEEKRLTDIAMSKVQGWTELTDIARDGAAECSHTDISSAATWEELKRRDPGLFLEWAREGKLKLGPVIAEGGEGIIHQASLQGYDFYAVKVFKLEGSSLADLQRQWPQIKVAPPPLGEIGLVSGNIAFGEPPEYCSYLYGATLLQDGRFAFVMPRFWGDLRALINDRLSDNRPPFSHPITVNIMLQIGKGMLGLHKIGVLHRDLKAANVLVTKFREPFKPMHDRAVSCFVADYESSKMVQGTEFWRAPEVLEELLKEARDRDLEIWTEKVDIYSYAMTCYEILTGQVPFFEEHYTKRDWKKVIDGGRPPFPNYVDPGLQKLVERCWHKEPSMRPTFEVIVAELEAIELEATELEATELENERHARTGVFQKLRHKIGRLFK